MTLKETTHEISRDGDRALRFTGELIGEGETGSGGQGRHDWTRGVRIRIFRTNGGKYIIHHHTWSRWIGEGNHNDVQVCDTVDEILDAFRDDWGYMSPAAVEAWEDAGFPPEEVK